MNCGVVGFDCASFANILIGAAIGFFLSWCAALFYECYANRRNETKQRETFQFLESHNDKFDWQHWDITNGKIATSPIDAYKRLKYMQNGQFLFEWKAPDSKDIKGDGYIFWKDITHGRMSFYSHKPQEYNYRNVFYRRIDHQDKKYDAIFVNADDYGTKYVLLREVDVIDRKLK